MGWIKTTSLGSRSPKDSSTTSTACTSAGSPNVADRQERSRVGVQALTFVQKTGPHDMGHASRKAGDYGPGDCRLIATPTIRRDDHCWQYCRSCQPRPQILQGPRGMSQTRQSETLPHGARCGILPESLKRSRHDYNVLGCIEGRRCSPDHPKERLAQSRAGRRAPHARLGMG
jgi:hypothetical protein